MNGPTFRGVPLHADGSATFEGMTYSAEYVAKRLDVVTPEAFFSPSVTDTSAQLADELAKADAPRVDTRILDLAHGLHRDIPEDAYHARIHGMASTSILSYVLRSPAHYMAYVDGAPREESGAFALGKAAHCRLLEPQRFIATHARRPSMGDGRTKAGKAAREAWEQLCRDTGISVAMSAEDWATCEGMAIAAQRHPTASILLAGGHAEVTMRWRDMETGIECRARLDYWRSDLPCVVDVKTTEDARAFGKSVANYDYHRQAALYLDGLATLGVEVDADAFVFAVFEKAAPWSCSLHRLDEEAIAQGRAENRAALRTLADCLARDEWPGYGTDITTISLPSWRLGRSL